MTRDEKKEYMRKYYKEHKDNFNEYGRKHYKEHKEERKEYNRAYKVTHLAYYNMKQKEYRQEHKDKVNKYMYMCYHKNPHFRLLSCLRSRLWQALKGTDKSDSTIKLIGCSIDELKNHLEKQFIKGMSWKSYGKWHVDHIKPCCSFDLSKPKEQYKCFNYTNLQPLWAKDNCSKSRLDKQKHINNEGVNHDFSRFSE